MCATNLTPEHKACRQNFCEENLYILRANPENAFSRIITGDETWDHHHDPLDQTRVMQWKRKGSPTPKKFHVQQSAGKIVASVFWDSEGVLLFEFMPYKTPMLPKSWLCARISNKRRGKLSGVLLLHDNEPAHNPRTSRAAIRKCSFVELNHPPYSPDLASSNYFLFRNLKKNSAWATISR